MQLVDCGLWDSDDGQGYPGLTAGAGVVEGFPWGVEICVSVDAWRHSLVD